MQVLVSRIGGSVDDVFVPPFASFNVKSLSGWARTRRSVAGAARDSHCPRVIGMETNGEHIAQSFGDIITRLKKIWIPKFLKLSKNFWKAYDEMIEVVSV